MDEERQIQLVSQSQGNNIQSVKGGYIQRKYSVFGDLLAVYLSMVRALLAIHFLMARALFPVLLLELHRVSRSNFKQMETVLSFTDGIT